MWWERWDTFTRIGVVSECLGSQLSLVSGPGVAIDFLQCRMTRDGHNLMAATIVFSQAPSCRFSQSMCRAMFQSCLIAAVSEPVAEALDSERLSIGIYKE